MVFVCLSVQVVKNKAVTKTQKVRFFTAVLLTDVSSLYRWDGIIDVSTEDNDTVSLGPQSGAG
jgi:hypothetical protein